jgi:hypothetical protein
MRPAGWTWKLRAAARRRPSWNTRWEAMMRAAAANWCGEERVVGGGCGDVDALRSRVNCPSSEPMPKQPIAAPRLVTVLMPPENSSRARLCSSSLRNLDIAASTFGYEIAE